MRERLAHLKADPFFRHNLVYFGGTMTAAFLNYLYHPILSRLMSVESFGETQALFSIYTQGGVVLSVLGMVMMNIFANRTSKDERSDLVATLYSLSFFLMLILAVGLIFLSPILARSMQFASTFSFFIVSAILLLSVPFSFYRYFLQSQHNFSTVSTLAIIAAVGRLLASALLVLVGGATFGAMGGLLIAVWLTLLYARKKVGNRIHLPRIRKVRLSAELRGESAYAALVFCGLMLITLLYTADTLVVKHFFDPDVAGLYSGVATVARTILFATGSIAGVLIAHIKLTNTSAENHRVFMKGLILTLLVGGGFLILFALFPTAILTLLVGGQYVTVSHLLPLLALTISIISLGQLFASYFLALRTYLLIPIALGGFVFLSISVAVFHNSPDQIIYDFLAASALTLLAFLILYVRQRQKYDTKGSVAEPPTRPVQI